VTSDLVPDTASEILAGYHKGEFSPREIVSRTLERIAAVNPVINAHWHTTSDAAIDAATQSTERWRAGAPRPLEGIPVGVKDVIDVAGHPCTGGSSIYLGRRAQTDATVVARLRAAGAIVVTKDATTEFGIGGPLNPSFGPTRNPWNLQHWTGGSSCGAAAGLAAGTIPLAVGTDAGGSVRMPAAWSGVVGLKPTMGRVSRRGVMPCSWHAEVVGPMARTVSDASRLLNIIAGFDPHDPRTVPADYEPTHSAVDVRSLRIGIAPEWWESLVDSATARAVADATDIFRDAGAQIIPLTGLPPARELHDLSYEIVFAEASWVHESHANHHDSMDPVTVRRLGTGRGVAAAAYFELLQRRADAQRRTYAALDPVDVLLTPTTVTTAPRLDQLELTIDNETVPLHHGYALLTAHANLTGFPALAVPAGLTTAGMPLSIQFTARPWNENACCRAGHAFERLSRQTPLAPDLTLLKGGPTMTRVRADGAMTDSAYLSGRLDPGGVDPFLGPLATG